MSEIPGTVGRTRAAMARGLHAAEPDAGHTPGPEPCEKCWRRAEAAYEAWRRYIAHGDLHTATDP
jgi:hypothetical protein